MRDSTFLWVTALVGGVQVAKEVPCHVVPPHVGFFHGSTCFDATASEITTGDARGLNLLAATSKEDVHMLQRVRHLGFIPHGRIDHLVCVEGGLGYRRTCGTLGHIAIHPSINHIDIASITTLIGVQPQLRRVVAITTKFLAAQNTCEAHDKLFKYKICERGPTESPRTNTTDDGGRPDRILRTPGFDQLLDARLPLRWKTCSLLFFRDRSPYSGDLGLTDALTGWFASIVNCLQQFKK